MSARLDHVVVVVASLAEATEQFSAAGFTVLAGGRHVDLPTKNALVVFADGTYLELLATCDPETRQELRAAYGTPRWERHLGSVSAVARRFLPLLAQDDGVRDWVLRSDSLPRDAADLRHRGLQAAGPVPMSRERPDGVKLEWELLLPLSYQYPFVIKDRTPRERRVPDQPGATTHANGATGIAEIWLRTEVAALAALDMASVYHTVPHCDRAGVTRLHLQGFDVRFETGEPVGAFVALLKGVRGLPVSIGRLGLTPANN